MRRSLASILAMFIVVSPHTGCAGFSLVAANERSEQTKGERVTVTVMPEEDRSGDVGLPSFPGGIIPVLIDQGFKIVEREIEREAARYTATYTAFGVGDAFYAASPDDSSQSEVNPEVALDGLVIERKIMHERADGALESATAMTLQLDLVRSVDGRYFRLVPATIELPYAKCKLRAGDDDVDIEVRVTLDTYWVDENRVARTDSIEIAPIIVPGIPVGPQSEWTSVQNEAVNGHLAKIPSTWLPLIRRSVGMEDGGVSYGRGTFVVHVHVREYDDFGERVRAIGEFVRENRDDWSEEIVESISNSGS